MKKWEDEQIEHWETQIDLEFLNYFKTIIKSIDDYDINKLGNYDLYVYNRIKKIIRDRKINSIIGESRILNFNHFKNLI